ncbi:MAG TPA: TetR/AcrR family transcriptional regulator [Candidatus Dormibacteraeota bacterium]
MAAPRTVRERILKEASKVLADNAQASVEQIAEASHISRTTFYRSFESRRELLKALSLEPEPDTADRVLEAALRMLRTQSLGTLSMDELAGTAGVSRANLYRLFPGKAALFKAILLAYSPFEPVMAIFERIGDRPPDELIPELVRTAYRTMSGRTGVVRTLLFEATSMTPETQQAFSETGLRAFGTLAMYLSSQMEAGRLRRISPLIALQALIGGVMFHLLSEPIFAAMTDVNGDQAVTQLAENWLRGMRPDQ